MSGPPGPQWSQFPQASGPGQESPAALDATLRGLREERGRLAGGVGEQLFRMVMSGQIRDPAVIAVCRPLYDLDQQIFRVEAALRTYGSQPLQSQMAPMVPAGGMPGQRPPWESGPSPAAPPPNPAASRQPTRQCAHCRTPVRANDQQCPVCGRSTADALPLAAAAPAPDAPTEPCAKCGKPLRAHDRFCPECGTSRPM